MAREKKELSIIVYLKIIFQGWRNPWNGVAE